MTQETENVAPMRFFLTQRLTRRSYPGGQGFDGLFACQYMGAAEFEWGAIPESLARMREVKRLGVHAGAVTRRGVTVPVFVVGDARRIQRVPGDLTAWLADDYPRGKEMTYFPEAVEGIAKDWQCETHAWWSLKDDVMWTLDIDTAELLLKAIRSRPNRPAVERDS